MGHVLRLRQRARIRGALAPTSLSPLSLQELYTLDKCHKGLITSCTPGNATLVWYDDTTNKCTGAVNDTRSYVPGTCTQTGPKSARASKLVTCS